MRRGYAAIGLDRPKKGHNIGGCLRAAHAFGAALIVVSGRRYSPEAEDTSKAYRHVPLVHSADPFEAAPYAALPVAVEIVDDAIPLPAFKHPEAAFYLFGPEDGSLRREWLQRCAHVVSIPTALCLNLSQAVNIVLYDRAAKAGG